jgi:anti-sigma regulatory factor (Ser/Thr protein kinase)
MSAAFQMMIGSTATEVAALLDAFSRFAERGRIPDPVRRDLLVALDEVLANVVMHGSDGATTAVASVTVHLLADAVQVVVADTGVSFDPLAQAPPDTTLSIEARPIGGLGLHLVQRLMDDTRYAREDAQNILTLTKRLPTAGAPDPTGAA